MKKRRSIAPTNWENLAKQARAEYEAPVDVLFGLPELDFGQKWPDYAALPLSPREAPQLQKMACDLRLDVVKSTWDAPLHAMRVLSTWGDPSFLPALFQTFADREENDFFHEDLSKIIGRLGPVALEIVQEQLDVVSIGDAPILADGLVEIAEASRPHRAQIVEIFRLRLEKFADNDADWNGFMVANIIDLAAGELLPLIEKAVRAGAINTRICGDMTEIRAELGLAEPTYNPSKFLAVKTSQGVKPPSFFGPKRLGD